MSPDECVFCGSLGCVDGTANHGTECPFTTGLWPVDQAAIDRETVCAACGELFALGDVIAQVHDMTHPAIAGVLPLAEAMGLDEADISFSVCVGCAALGRDLLDGGAE